VLQPYTQPHGGAAHHGSMRDLLAIQQQQQQQMQLQQQRCISPVPTFSASSPSPFLALLCRAGRGLDLTAPPANDALFPGQLGGVECISERVLAAQDDFALVSTCALARNVHVSPAAAHPSGPGSGPGSGPSGGAGAGAVWSAAAAPFPDVSSLCHFVLTSPTPSETVARIVEAQTRSHAAAAAHNQHAKHFLAKQTLMITIVYF